jgi:hypothetical protein
MRLDEVVPAEIGGLADLTAAVAEPLIGRCLRRGSAPVRVREARQRGGDTAPSGHDELHAVSQQAFELVEDVGIRRIGDGRYRSAVLDLEDDHAETLCLPGGEQPRRLGVDLVGSEVHHGQRVLVGEGLCELRLAEPASLDEDVSQAPVAAMTLLEGLEELFGCQ